MEPDRVIVSMIVFHDSKEHFETTVLPAITHTARVALPDAKFFLATKPFPPPLQQSVCIYVYHPNLDTAKLLCQSLFNGLDAANKILAPTSTDFALLILACDRDLQPDPDGPYFKLV